MEFDDWTKVLPILTTAIFGATTAWLAWNNHLDSKKNAWREEYKFAKTFFDDLLANPAMHSFARKKGYQAIGGNKDLSPAAIEHLMTLNDPVAALSDYEYSRSYLRHQGTPDRRQLSFIDSRLLATEGRRKVWRNAMVLVGAIFYLIAFTPWALYSLQLISDPFAIGLTLAVAPPGFWATIFLWKEAAQISRAMRLLKTQNQEADAHESGQLN